MSRFRTFARRLRTLLWTALGLVTVLAAVLVGVGELVMPYSDRYQPRLEAWLSREFGQAVTVERFTGEWKVFGPRIRFENLAISAPVGEPDAIAIADAQLDVHVLSLLIPGRRVYQFSVVGADLEARREADGQWVVSGLGVSRREDHAGSPVLQGLVNLGEIRLRDSSLRIHDEQDGFELAFTAVNARVQFDRRNLAGRVQARLDRGDDQVYGDLEGTVRLELDDVGRPSAATWHAKVRELLLDTLRGRVPYHPLVPERGRVNGELWGEWSISGPTRLDGVADVRDAWLRLEGSDLVARHANGLFRWEQRGYRDWRLDLADVSIERPEGAFETRRVTVDRRVPDNLGLWLSADRIPGEVALPIARTLTAWREKPWPRHSPRRAEGLIEDLDLVLDPAWGLVAARGRMQGGRISEWGPWPDLEGVDLVADLALGSGEARIAAPDLRVTWPRVFRRQLEFGLPPCEVGVSWVSRTGYRIDLPDCTLENEDVAVSGRARFALDGGRPEVDLNLAVPHADLGAMADYWPENLLSAGTLRWLRRGLLDGTARDARFSLSGDLDDFPFHGGTGLLLAEVPLSGGDLDYADGWPVARDIDAIARFRNTSMTIGGDIGELAGATVSEAEGAIADFERPEFTLAWQTVAPLPAMMRFVEAIPIGEGLSAQLPWLGFEGDATVAGSMSLPLGDGSGPGAVNGTVRLSGNGVTERRSGLALDDIEGTLTFDEDGFAAERLGARWGEEVATIDLRGGDDPERPFELGIHGNFNVTQLVPAAWRGQLPLLEALNGWADFDLGLVVGAADSAHPGAWLRVDSDLVGVAMTLPEPLAKDAGETMPLHLEVPLGGPGIVTAAAGDRVRLRAELAAGEDASPRLDRAVIRLGPGEATLPPSGSLSFTGVARSFDLDGWLALTASAAQGGGDALGVLTVHAAEFEAEQLRFINRDYRDVGLALRFDGDLLVGRFDSADITGEVRYSPGGASTHRLVAEFERLVIPRATDEAVSLELDPTLMPSLHLYAREFAWLGLELGETRIESYPTTDGLHFETVEAHSPKLSFRARGDWALVQGARGAPTPRSDFDIHISSESLGSLLQALNLSSALEGGQTIVDFDTWWPGSPAAFGLEHLNGDMEVSILRGALVNAEPGAGRMLGLISIQALPRRLALDFTDVFSSGFKFDQAAGTMSFSSGVAYTEGFVMQSPAANITISGETDLERQRFDYLVTVKPGLGSALPVIGAVAGGPAGAAAGLALQGLLQNQLGDAAQAQYTITGPWEDPAVERVENDDRVPEVAGRDLSGYPNIGGMQ